MATEFKQNADKMKLVMADMGRGLERNPLGGCKKAIEKQPGKFV